MTRIILALATITILTSCADPIVVPTDPVETTGTSTAATGGGGAGGEQTGGGANGGGGSGGATPTCADPTEVEVGVEGGELSHCGATLVVPEGAVADATTFSIAVVESPAPAPFEHELASPVYEIAASSELQALVSLELEYEPEDSRFKLARFDDELGEFAWIEACEVTETTIQQHVGVLGTWTVLRDTNDYPDSTSGLGDGSMSLDFLGEDVLLDLDGPGSYGIYQNSPNGDRNVTLVGWNEVDGGVEQLRIDFVAHAAGGGTLIQIAWTSTVLGGGYTYIDGLLGSAGVLTVDEVDGRLVGTASANLQGGDPPVEEPLSVSFDVAVEAFAFPPELSCPGGV